MTSTKMIKTVLLGVLCTSKLNQARNQGWQTKQYSPPLEIFMRRFRFSKKIMLILFHIKKNLNKLLNICIVS